MTAYDHEHDIDYAKLYHRHYDLERETERLKALLEQQREDLAEALARIRVLEQQTAEARQAG